MENEKRELLQAFHNIRKLNHSNCHHQSFPQGEFMMLAMIELMMEDKEKVENKEPGIKISELSGFLHATKPATSKMIRNIEEKGLVKRIADDIDRRIVYVNLTSKGKEELSVMKKWADEFLTSVIDRLGINDTKELLRIFNDLQAIMKDEFLKRKENKKE